MKRLLSRGLCALALAGLCRADLITFGSTPADTIAVLADGTLPTTLTAPFETPCCVVTYAGSEWVTALTEEPFAVEEDFFIPYNFDITAASLLFKTNFVQGPAAYINGNPVPLITYSEIRNMLPWVHNGWNTFESETDPGITVDVAGDVWGYYRDGGVVTPEPGSMGLLGVGLVVVAWQRRKRDAHWL